LKTTDELRFQKKMVELNNQAIIQLAYLTMETLEPLIDSGNKLFFEQASCYHSCFYICRSLLKKVDPEYLKGHSMVATFFKEGRELSNDWDCLSWAPTEDVNKKYFVEGKLLCSKCFDKLYGDDSEVKRENFITTEHIWKIVREHGERKVSIHCDACGAPVA
jgi:hypothetical protein